MNYTNHQFIVDYQQLIKKFRKDKSSAWFAYLKQIPFIGKLLHPMESNIGYASFNSGDKRIYVSNFFIEDIGKLHDCAITSQTYLALFNKTASSLYHEYQHYIDLQNIDTKTGLSKNKNKVIASCSPDENNILSTDSQICDYFFSGLEFNAYSVTIATIVSSLIHHNKCKNKSIDLVINDVISDYKIKHLHLDDILSTKPLYIKIFKRKVYAYLHSKLIDLTERTKIIQLKTWFAQSSMGKDIKLAIYTELLSNISKIQYGKDNSSILSKYCVRQMIRSEDPFFDNIIGHTE
jgi:hypothetical protein